MTLNFATIAAREGTTVNKINMLDGCIGTNELNKWETEFIESLMEEVSGGRQHFTSKQCETIDRLYNRIFAG